MIKKLVILPTYNESKNIINIIDMLSKLDIDLDILVIDDNSPDNTAQIVKKYNNDKVFIEERAEKNGLGTAYVHGFNWALKNNYDKISEVDINPLIVCKKGKGVFAVDALIHYFK